MDDRASKRLITLDDLADTLLWLPRAGRLAEHLYVDERTVRARVRTLTDVEKHHIECRLAAQDGAA